MKSTTPHPTRLSLGKQLESLNQQVAECKKCSFCIQHKPLDKQKYGTIKYDGIPYLVEDFYLFVGDYPTEVEDIVITPLVDKEARVVRNLITSLLSPEKFLVVNSIICPPYHIKPTIKEQLDCSHHLLNYINTLKPKTIFSIGKFPAKLLKKLDIPFIELPGIDAVASSQLQYQRFKLILSKHLELQGTNQ